MSFLTPEAKETVATLRDRLKHGQNMTKILESQLDTAQQNISLLQGQVRLANETILNLKKYFQETENTINELLIPNHQSSRKFHFDNTHKDNDEGSSKNHQSNESRSPCTPESSESKHQDEREKRESHNKSPYAQQLRQVLDVLQDEEPRKSSSNHHNDKDCSCTECQPHMQRTSSSKSFHENEHYQRKGSSESEYCKIKHKANGHSGPREQISPKSPFYRVQSEGSHHHGAYSNHCMGPCCQNDSAGSYKVIEKSNHYIESEKSSHYLEKSPSGSVHYIAVHSPEGTPKHSDRHHGHHINYVPYGYHMSDNPHKMMHEVIPPMSPSGRRKRAYMPILPNEEPPHLKYTKVKRIDGSKLTAQKVLQDFTKRRFIAYNPRYDLDLLIVPPPIPASDLVKFGNKFRKTAPVEPSHAKNDVPNSVRDSPVENGRPEMYPDSDSISPRDTRDERDDEDVFADPKDNDLSDSNNNNNTNNNNNITNDDNNNNNKNNKVPWAPKQSMFSSKGVSVLPSIKEEPRSKLEDQITKLRNDQSFYLKTNSPYNDNNNNNDSPKNLMIHERGASPPVNGLVNRRTEQYCS